MQPDQLMKFRESILSDEIGGKHIGMRNVHRRIQLHLGEAYGLKIDSEWEKGTIVTILLPVKDQTDDRKKGKEKTKDTGETENEDCNCRR